MCRPGRWPWPRHSCSRSFVLQPNATDPSEGMIKQAQQSTPKDQYPHVEFHVASAESLPFLETNSVDMVVAGQAAHWFDFPKVFTELKRVVRQGGTMAFWGYKDHVFVDYPRATDLTNHYAYDLDNDKLGPYWSQPGRSYLQDKLRVIKPPDNDWEDIERIEYEPGTAGGASGEGTMSMNTRISIAQCKEYMRTWSSYHGWKETHKGMQARSKRGEGDVVDELFDKIAAETPDFKNESREVNLEWGSALIMARKN